MSMCHMQPGWLKMTNLIRHKKVSLNCMGLSVVCASFPRGQHCRGLTMPILLWEADNGFETSRVHVFMNIVSWGLVRAIEEVTQNLKHANFLVGGAQYCLSWYCYCSSEGGRPAD